MVLTLHFLGVGDRYRQANWQSVAIDLLLSPSWSRGKVQDHTVWGNALFVLQSKDRVTYHPFKYSLHSSSHKPPVKAQSSPNIIMYTSFFAQWCQSCQISTINYFSQSHIFRHTRELCLSRLEPLSNLISTYLNLGKFGSNTMLMELLKNNWKPLTNTIFGLWRPQRASGLKKKTLLETHSNLGSLIIEYTSSQCFFI